MIFPLIHFLHMNFIFRSLFCAGLLWHDFPWYSASWQRWRISKQSLLRYMIVVVFKTHKDCFTSYYKPALVQSKRLFRLVLLAQVSLPNLAAATQTPQPPPLVSLQCPPHSLNRARSPLKIRGRRTQVKPNRVRPRLSSTPLCLQVTAIPACPTTPGSRECPVPSSTAPLSSCLQHPQSSTAWAHPASTNTRPDTASTRMAQVNGCL